MNHRNIHFEVSVLDPSDRSTKTLRLTSIDAMGGEATQADGYEWEPVITEWPTRTVDVMAGGNFSQVSTDHGSISFSIIGNPEWAKLSWSGALGRIWIGEGDGLGGRWFEGSISGLEIADDIATVTLLGAEAYLDVELLAGVYAGTGGVEGPAGVRNRRKPWTSGECQNVEPVKLYDGQYWFYQWHGYGATDGTRAVYENALQLPAAKARVNTLAQAIAAAPAPGEWVDIPGAGGFLLGAEPTGKITADVGGAKFGTSFPTSLADIAAHMVEQAGIPASGLDTASLAAFDQPWCAYVSDETTVGDLLRRALYEHGGYLISKTNGVLAAGSFLANSAPSDLYLDSSGDRTVLSSPRLIASPSIVYSVRIGHSRCWSVHSANEVSGALTAISEDAQAARQAAEAAQEAAEQAQADGAVLISQINEMSEDAWLDRAEKKRLERDYAEASTTKTALVIQAQALGITTQVSSYVAAFDGLTAYLNGLAPAWNDSSAATPIDRAQFNATWSSYVSRYVALQNKIADVTAARAGNAQDTADDAKGAADQAAADASNAIGKVDDVATDLEGVKETVDQTVTKTTTLEQKFATLDAAMDGAESEIADLKTTYGSTAAAAASADAAAQHLANAQTAATNAAQAKTDAEQAEADAVAAKTAAESARATAQTHATNAGSAKTAAETAKTAAESAKTAAQTAKTDAEAAFSNSTTAKNAAQAAQTAAETAKSQAQTQATNASNSATAAAGSASTASTKATDAGKSAAAAAASQVSAQSAAADSQDSADAAATSASAASTSAGQAGQSATAAQTSATTATTQAGKASTSATNAATSETNAKGSENAAKSSQTAAATSATTAGQKADAAAISASTASTKATEAGQSASSAQTSATTATTKAGEASTSATQSASSASDALASKNAAASSASTAATSATNAKNSATAASDSASTATTQASNAGNSATSAAASAVSASSAYDSTLSALYTSSPILPATFEEGAKHWTRERLGNPINLTDIPATAVMDADMGPSLEITNWAGAGNNVMTKGVIAPKPGRIYEVSVTFKIMASDGSVSFNSALGTMVAGYGAAASNLTSGASQTFTTTGVVNTMTRKYSLDTINGVTKIPADVQLFRAGLRLNSSEASGSLVFRVGEIRITDVTEREAALAAADGAANSASAASTSASQAATSATAAGTSANSASTSANTASTKAGEASTSANQAASSESSANASKNAASTSANNAANSATQAGNSATAASGSASNASTSATQAGNSAQSAAASAVSASSSYDSARLTAASMLPSDFGNPDLWSHTFTGAPGTQAALTSAVTFVDVASVGRVAQMTGTSTYRYIAPVGAVSVTAGRTYRLTMSVRATSATSPVVRLYGIYLSSSFGQIGQPSVPQTLAVRNQWYDYVLNISGDDVIAGGGAYLRPLLRLDPGETHTIQLASLKIEDVTSQLAAESSASAAATSASQAGTSATQAGTSANSATQSANTATTRANEAAASASSAANSASSASSSSSAAGNSATAANSSDVSAKLTAASLMPSDFQQDGRYWQQGFGGLPQNLNSITANSTFAFVNNSDVGRTMRVTASGQTDVGNIGMIPLQADRVYRLTAKVRQQTGSVFAQVQLYRIGVNATGSTMGNGTVTNPSSYTFTALNQWVELTGTVSASTTNAMIAAGASSIRSLLRLAAASSTVTVDYAFIRIEDITESSGAAGSASAAANSASQASASQAGAASSASSAQTNATNAATSAGQASTSASQASTSANNAANSANTASTQATNAANSANAAGGSASAAQSSASTASTQANNAANSAAVASTQALYASSRAAGNFVAKPTFEDGDTGMWNGSVSVTSYANSSLGTTKELRSRARDATEGADFIQLPMNTARVFRVSGYARGGSSSAYAVRVGVQGQLANGSFTYPMSAACAAGVTTWTYFEYNLAIAATILRFKPFIQSNNDSGQPGSVHDARVVGLRIEDITESNSAAGSASAAASSASTASTKAGEAGQSATSASNSANTANIRAGEASSSASAAAGSAATASSAASTATTQATLAATYSTGGGNLLAESSFEVGQGDWEFWSPSGNADFSFGRDLAGDSWRPMEEHVLGIRQASSAADRVSQMAPKRITVLPGVWYEFSAFLAAHRCNTYLRVDWYDANNNFLRNDYSNGNNAQKSGGPTISNWLRCWNKVKSPSNAATCFLIFAKDGTAGGQPDSYAWMARPMFRETYEQASGPSPYAPANGRATQAAQQALITTTQTAIATANSTIANHTTRLQAAEANVSQTMGAVSNLQGRTTAFWQVEAVGGDGRAKLRVVADSNGGGGVDIEGDVRISGDAMIGGTINPEALDLSRFVRKIGPASATASDARLMYAVDLGTTIANGEYQLQGQIGFTYTSGRQTMTQSGRPYYIDYLNDGGMLIALTKNGQTIAQRLWTGNMLSVYGAQNFTADITTIFDDLDLDTSTGNVTLAVYSRKGNSDTGMINQGDYYTRQLSGNYYNFSMTGVKCKWRLW